ncbi:MAG: contractile injection system protein, VgrG/Pvc8 family [Candidatus Krumholzibacteria bacterium]
MLTFEEKPKFLESYSVRGFEVRQTIGEVGSLSVTLHPSKGMPDSELAAHAELQEFFGQEFTCRVEDWKFTGTVEALEFDSESGFRLILRDAMSRLAQTHTSQVFVDQSLSDVLGTLIPSGVPHECLAGCDSYMINLAIQYQESNLDFLKRLLHGIGGQIWCSAGKIFVATGLTALQSQQGESFSPVLRLRKEITDYTIRTELGPEKVTVETHPYVENNNAQSTDVELEKAPFGFGKVQDSLIDIRKKNQGDESFHVIHEDAGYDARKRWGEHFLRAHAHGRFLVQGTLRTPVPVGSEVQIAVLDPADGSGKDLETAFIRSINGYHDYRADESSWQFEAANLEGLYPEKEWPDRRLIASAATVVDTSENDPLKYNRVKVEFAWDKLRSVTPWLRVATPSWGEEHALYIPPELDDIVLVLWGQVDMDPVVIGSVPAGFEVEDNAASFFFKTVQGQTLTIGENNIKFKNEVDGGGSTMEILPDKIVIGTGDGSGGTIEIQDDKIVITTANGQTVSLEQGKVKIDSAEGSDIEIKTAEIAQTATKIALKASQIDAG